MNDLSTAIILAAGSSRRMGRLARARPKCLLDYGGEPILCRLLRQLADSGVTRAVITAGHGAEAVRDAVAKVADPAIEVAFNRDYASDVNIGSMQLALARVHGAVAIFEADTIMEDAMVAYTCGADFEGRSAWFTRGPFTEGMYGGIVRSDGEGRIVDARVVRAFAPELAGFTKMTGVMRISAAMLPRCRELVARAAAQTSSQYFFQPWCSRLDELVLVEGDARHYRFESFNTPEEYRRVTETAFDGANGEPLCVELAEIARLRPIEGFDPARVRALASKIAAEGAWTRPLIVEREHRLVLDGRHRMEVCQRLGLARVPVHYVDYRDVPVWTLRKAEKVDADTVIRRARAGDVYPYKTVKHKVPGTVARCRLPLEELR